MRNMRSNYRRGGFNHSRSRFPTNNRKPARVTISESDLIRSIEYSKQIQKNPQNLENDTYIAINSFENLQINYQLKKNIQIKGYKTMTQIQDQAIPHMLAGKDLIGIANTGTGKTAAFLIPLIEKVSKDRNQKVLIVAPTRELAEQINTEFKAFVNQMGIYSALIMGGKSMYYQMRDLQRNPNFVIGTPGRIKDMIERNTLRLSGFNNVVLDETDRMVDIGFIKEIKLFISLLPKFRQSLFFSATISRKVEEIIYSFVRNAITVSVKKTDTCKNIKQDYIKINKNQLKVDCLHDLLIKDGFE